MATEIKTEILITASPEKVWEILTNFNNYSSWNPFIKSVKGEVIVGNKITIRIEPPGAKGMTFKPEVLIFEMNKELRWLGHLFLPGIFDGEHKFELIDNKNKTIQSVEFQTLLKICSFRINEFNPIINVETSMGRFIALSNSIRLLCSLSNLFL